MQPTRVHPRSSLALGALLVMLGVSYAPASALQRVARAQTVAATSQRPVIATPAPTARVRIQMKPVSAGDAASVASLRAANAARGMKILVSTKQRQLWLINNKDTLLVTPVAVGMGKDFTFNGKKFHFKTPAGRRKVLSKSEAPIWTVPEWHYMERAAAEDHDLVYLKADSRIELSDGTFLEVREKDVGRVNHLGNFWAFEPGLEIMFDDKVYVPPITTNQRRVPEALGPFKLDMGEGYLIHGTHIYNEDSVGDAVSHGCVRMDNFDLERLYYMVNPGTPVFIF